MHKDCCLGVALLVLGFSVVAGCYWLGLSGPFLFDDFHNLESMAIYGGVESFQDALRFIFGQDGLQWERSLARASFLINDQYWPSIPDGFKGVNIALHMATALMVFLVVFTLLDRSQDAFWKAASICVLWALLPMHVSTVLYVVQRMTVLATLLIMVSLYLMLLAAESAQVVRRVVLIVFAFVITLLALLTKENAVVILLLLPLVYFFRVADVNYFTNWQRVLIAASPVVFFILLLVAAVLTWGHYEGRDFTGFERLLKQGPIIFYYAFQTLWFFDSYTLFHDGDWVASLPWFANLLAWGLHVLIIRFAWINRRHHRLLLIGIFWFYASHTVESTVIPLELIFEHRNYLPSIGLVMCLGYLLGLIVKRVRFSGVGGIAALSLPSLVICLETIALGYQCAIWSDYRILSSKWAADYPHSMRAQASFVATLEQSGLVAMAYDKVDAVVDDFNDPSLYMQRYYLGCELGLEGNSLDLAQLSSMNFSAGVLFEYKRIIEREDPCLQKSLANGYDGLTQAIAAMPLLAGKKAYAARFYDIAAGAYVKIGNYAAALRSREMAWELQPTVATTLKLAEVYIMGGDLMRASSTLEFALKLDGRRWFRDDKAHANIERLIRVVESLKSIQVNK